MRRKPTAARHPWVAQELAARSRCLGLAPRPGQREPERAAAALGTIDTDLTAMCAYHVAGDGETKTGPPAGTARPAVELLEDPLPLILGHAWARVRDLEAHAGRSFRGAQINPPSCRGVTQGVLQQVLEHEAKPLKIGSVTFRLTFRFLLSLSELRVVLFRPYDAEALTVG